MAAAMMEALLLRSVGLQIRVGEESEEVQVIATGIWVWMVIFPSVPARRGRKMGVGALV